MSDPVTIDIDTICAEQSRWFTALEAWLAEYREARRVLPLLIRQPDDLSDWHDRHCMPWNESTNPAPGAD
jgi:hypothetical protein